MISGGPVAIAEHSIIEQKSKSRERAVETGFSGRPIIRMLGDLREVGSGYLPHAWIFDDNRLAIERKSGIE